MFGLERNFSKNKTIYCGAKAKWFQVLLNKEADRTLTFSPQYENSVNSRVSFSSGSMDEFFF